MEKLVDLQREDVERSLKPKTVLEIQIICGSMIAGVLMFFGVDMVLYGMSPKHVVIRSPETEMILFAVMGSLSLGALVAAMFLPSVLLNPDRLATRLKTSSADPVDWALSIYRVTMIVRMALLESASLFGLVLLMLSVMNRSLDAQPVLWLSVSPAVVFVLFGVITFPSRVGIVEFIGSRILTPLRQRS